MELRTPVVTGTACLYLEEGGAPPGVGGILGFGGSRDSWKCTFLLGKRTLLVISGSPGITRNDEMLHDRGPFRESWEMGKCEKVRKWERVLNLEPRNPCSLLHVIFANRVQR